MNDSKKVMRGLDKRPSPLTMAKTDNYLEHSKECYLQYLKRNYAQRLDDIHLSQSVKKLSEQIDSLRNEINKGVE